MFDRLYRVIMAFGVIAIGTIALVSFFQVVSRFTFNSSIPWSNELVQIAMMWMVLVCAGAMLWRGAHFSLDYLLQPLPPPLQRALRMTSAVLIAGFSVFLVVIGWRLAMSQMGQEIASLGISYGVVYLAMPVGASLMLIFSIGSILRLRKGVKDGESHGGYKS
jgi:C4-dicarboxylate transporter DctQ subunit